MTTPAPKTSLGLGVAAALAGAVAGAVLWAVLVSVTNYKIGYAAVGVGALAGFLGGRFGGANKNLPVLAAAIGLVGCFLGDVFSDAHAFSKGLQEFRHVNVSSFTVFKEMVKDPNGLGWNIYQEGFKAIDALFYAFAALAGFRLATAQQALHAAAAIPLADGTTPTATAPPRWDAPATTDPVNEPTP
jgi:hypothetical protein